MGVLRHWIVQDELVTGGNRRIVWDGKVADDFKRNGYEVHGPYVLDGPSPTRGAVSAPALSERASKAMLPPVDALTDDDSPACGEPGHVLCGECANASRGAV